MLRVVNGNINENWFHNRKDLEVILYKVLNTVLILLICDWAVVIVSTLLRF